MLSGAIDMQQVRLGPTETMFRLLRTELIGPEGLGARSVVFYH